MRGTQILNYTINQEIASGGMAKVYRAIHQRLGTVVAIKILNPILAADSQIRERFVNEAKVMASLNHPNITKVLDFEEKDDRLSIVMNHLEGEDLNSYIKRKGPLPLHEAQSIFFQMLDGFQYAHNEGVVHRDVKPSNIYIEKNGQVKILDFGIAKLLAQGTELTQTGTQMGTPIYMSPEQVHADKTIDPRSDIYSLGVTLYYMLSGEPPYDSTSNSNFDIFTKIVREPIPELAQYPTQNALIQKATQKNRDHRFQSCAEIKTAWSTPAAPPPQAEQQTFIHKTPPVSPPTPIPKSKPTPKTTVAPTPPPAKKKEKKSRSPFLWILLLVLAGAIGATLYFLNSSGMSDEEAYDFHMTNGIESMEAHEWDQARAEFNLAKAAAPYALDPDSKLFEIDQLHEKKAAFNENLKRSIEAGDKSFKEGEFQYAKREYESAKIHPLGEVNASFEDFVYEIPEDQLNYINSQIRLCEQNLANKKGPSDELKEKYLGTHPITNQWISWDYTGAVDFWESDGLIKILGEQRGRGANTSDFVKVDGVVEIVSALEFKLHGTIDLRIHHINDGKNCPRKGTFTFKSTKGRQYWRLQEMDSPCDITTDYVDIYFRKKSDSQSYRANSNNGGSNSSASASASSSDAPPSKPSPEEVPHPPTSAGPGNPTADGAFRVVEEMPRFPGCESEYDKKARKKCAEQKMLAFIYDNIQYPPIARENGVEGTVVISFVVETSGRLSDIKVVRDIGAECGTEALRVVKKMPKWVPGKQKGKKVRVLYNLPVKYKLN